MSSQAANGDRSTALTRRHAVSGEEGEQRATDRPTQSAPAGQPRAERLAVIAQGLHIVLATGVLLWLGRSFLVPFAIAMLLTLSVGRMMDWLEARARFPAWLSAIAAMLAILLVLAAVGAASYAGIADAIGSTSVDLLEPSETIESIANALQSRVQDRFDVRFGISAERIRGALASPSALGFVQSWLNSSVGLVSSLLLTAIFTVFLLTSRPLLRAKLKESLESWSLSGSEADALLTEAATGIRNFIGLKTAISVGTGLAFGATAWMIGVPFAPLWGFLGFVLNYIPTLGPVIASIPPIILCFVEMDSLPKALGAAGALIGVQVLSGSVIDPQLTGKQLDLNIVTILLCLFFWGLVWGPIGAFLAVPLTGLLRDMLARYQPTRFLSALMSGG